MLGLCVACVAFTYDGVTRWEAIERNGKIIPVYPTAIREWLSVSEDWEAFTYHLSRYLDSDIITEMRLNNFRMPEGTGLFAKVLVGGYGYCVLHTLDALQGYVPRF